MILNPFQLKADMVSLSPAGNSVCLKMQFYALSSCTVTLSLFVESTLDMYQLYTSRINFTNPAHKRDYSYQVQGTKNIQQLDSQLKIAKQDIQ